MRRLLSSTALIASLMAYAVTPSHAGFGSTVVDLFKGAFKSADDLAKAAKESAEAAIDGANVGRKLDDAAELGKYTDGPPPKAADEMADLPPGTHWSTRSLSEGDEFFGSGLRKLVISPDAAASGAVNGLRKADDVPPANIDGYAGQVTKNSPNGPKPTADPSKLTPGYQIQPTLAKNADNAAAAGDGYIRSGDDIFKTNVIDDAADEFVAHGYKLDDKNKFFKNADELANGYPPGPVPQNIYEDTASALAGKLSKNAPDGPPAGYTPGPKGPNPYGDVDQVRVPGANKPAFDISPGWFAKNAPKVGDDLAKQSDLIKKTKNGLPDAPNPYGQLKIIDDAASAAAKGGKKGVMRPAYPARYHEALAKVSVAAAKKAPGISPKKVIIGGTVTTLVVAGGVTTYVLYNTYKPVTEFVDGAVADTKEFGDKAKEDLENFGDQAEAGISEFGNQLGNAADQTADVFKKSAVLTVSNNSNDKVEVFEVVFGTRESRGVSQTSGGFVSFAGRVGDKIEITRNGEYFTGFTLEQDEMIYVQ